MEAEEAAGERALDLESEGPASCSNSLLTSCVTLGESLPPPHPLSLQVLISAMELTTPALETSLTYEG